MFTKGTVSSDFFFVVGAGVAILAGGLAATATAGFGLALIPIYWFAVMFHVYAIPDRVSPGVNDEGGTGPERDSLGGDFGRDHGRVNFLENLAQAVTEFPSG